MSNEVAVLHNHLVKGRILQAVSDRRDELFFVPGGYGKDHKAIFDGRAIQMVQCHVLGDGQMDAVYFGCGVI